MPRLAGFLGGAGFLLAPLWVTLRLTLGGPDGVPAGNL
jgi:hypothetical protein